jgi:hypothetical protein
MTLTGNITVSAQAINVVGHYSKSGNVTVSAITTGTTAVPDPFAGIAAPVNAGCTYNGYSQSGNGPLTLSAGTYCGGLSITGNHAVTVNQGTYIIDGGNLSISGNISLTGTGSGTTFYLTNNASLSISGNTSLDLSAPTTGAQTGMLFMQDPADTSAASITGNSGSTLAGNLYFPSAGLTLTGNASTSIPMGTVVAKTITISGNDAFSVSNSYRTTVSSPYTTGLFE